MLKFFGILIGLSSLTGLLSPLMTPLLIHRFPTLAWLFDLASHWQWLYVLLLILSSLLLATKHKGWLTSLVFITLPFFSATPVLKTAETNAKPLKIISANAYFENPDLSRLQTLITQEQPDLVVIVEFAPQHVKQVQAWADYPHQVLQPASGAFGMAILSRLPLSQTKTLTDQAGIEHIATQVAYTQPFTLIGLHPLPPLNKKLHQTRDALLQQLTDANGQARLIAGDFNASPWSSALQGLAAKNFYRTLNLLPTWPTSWQGLMGIPIDQVLASTQWKLISAKVGTSIGSDHYPVIVELSLSALRPHSTY